MLWLTGCSKIWRSVSRWRLSRCSGPGVVTPEPYPPLGSREQTGGCPRRDSNPYGRRLRPPSLPLDYAGVINRTCLVCVTSAQRGAAEDSCARLHGKWIDPAPRMDATSRTSILSSNPRNAPRSSGSLSRCGNNVLSRRPRARGDIIEASLASWSRTNVMTRQSRRQSARGGGSHTRLNRMVGEL